LLKQINENVLARAIFFYFLSLFTFLIFCLYKEERLTIVAFADVTLEFIKKS